MDTGLVRARSEFSAMPVLSLVEGDGNLAVLQVLGLQEVSPPCAWVPASLPERRCLAETCV